MNCWQIRKSYLFRKSQKEVVKKMRSSCSLSLVRGFVAVIAILPFLLGYVIGLFWLVPGTTIKNNEKSTKEYEKMEQQQQQQ